MPRFYLLSFFALLCWPIVARAQTELQHAISFRTDESGFHIDVTIEKGNTCFGIGLYHSTNANAGFVLVQEIAGLCGSTDAATYFSLSHPSPVAFDSNYYYLEFKGFGQSLPLSHFFVPYELSNFVIYTDNDRIWVYNRGLGITGLRVDLYSLQGQMLSSSPFESGRAGVPATKAFGRITLLLIQLENGQSIVNKLFITN